MRKLTGRVVVVAIVALLTGLVCSPASAGEKKRTVVYSIPSMFTTFFMAAYMGFEQQAKEYGWDAVMLDPNGDINLQMTQLYNQATREVDAVCITPLDSESTAPAFNELSKNGIPVFCIDRRGAGKVVSTLETNNVRVGVDIAAKVVEDFGGKPVKVLIVQGPLTESTILDRTSGMKETFAKHANVIIIGEPSAGVYTNEAAMSAAKNYLETNPDLNAIMTCTDALVPGVLAALKEADRLKPLGEDGHVSVYSVDGAGETLKYIEEGLVDATYSQYPIRLGTDVDKAMKRYFDGESVEEKIFFGGDVVTKYNIDELRPTLWGLKVN